MFNSLKSKFIVSFIVMEVVFFTLIVGLNFNSLDKASNTLLAEKTQISSQLLVELIKTPLITYDLATLDDIVKNFSGLKNVIAIEVDDNDNRTLSTYVKDGTINKKEFEKIAHTDSKISDGENEYIVNNIDIVVEDEVIGHIEFIFNETEHIKEIQKNKDITYLLILAAIIVGMIASYLIGSKLGKSLSQLTEIAKSVADDKSVSIPYDPEHSDEMGELFYAMHRMQKHISERTKNLQVSINDLKQFKNALNNSAIVSKTDPQGVITYVNSKFCEVTGYTETELLGQTHGILRDKDTGDDFYKDMWETLTSKKIFRSTFKNIKKNGEPYYVDATIVPLLDRQANIVEYIAIRYDVTELVDAKNKAIEAKKIKEEFLSNMSHEIRTPMNAILGFVQILQKNTTDEKSLYHLKLIKSSSGTLLNIINDILDFSKIESGMLQIDKHNFTPKEEFANTIELFTPRAEEMSINLVSNIDNSIPECLSGDFGRIQQVVFNFLSNAIKFTPENKSIFVDVVYDTKNSSLVISVKDEGIGIPQEAQKKIFNAFEQADSSTTRKYGGTGLGLSISTKLAHLMGGDISLKSQEGRGSTFILSLPMNTCIQDDEDALSTEENATKREFKGHLLIAEDNKMNQMLITILLDGYGLTYSIVNDGVEAVEAFKNSKYTMVLMDENMPNMTGVEAVQKIRQYEEKNKLTPTPIVALTANVMKEDKKRFENAGMNDFLAKPIDTKELNRVLERFLKNKK